MKTSHNLYLDNASTFFLLRKIIYTTIRRFMVYFIFLFFFKYNIKYFSLAFLSINLFLFSFFLTNIFVPFFTLCIFAHPLFVFVLLFRIMHYIFSMKKKLWKLLSTFSHRFSVFFYLLLLFIFVLEFYVSFS